MSVGKLPLQVAKRYADRVVELLAPHCERIEIAGSIRRRERWCGDIEIVCIPKPYQSSPLFTDGIAVPINNWEKVKGDMANQPKYTQRILPGTDGFKVDIFLVNEMNWGLQLAIRTGPADYSAKLAKIWVERGYNSVGGILVKRQTGKKYPMLEEKDLYDFLRLEWQEPPQRKSKDPWIKQTLRR